MQAASATSVLTSAAQTSLAAPALQPASTLLAPHPQLPLPQRSGAVAAVRAYAGICEQGFNEDQPDKPNQDAIVMLEGPLTSEGEPTEDIVVLAVFDGHGEDGHNIASFFRETLPGQVLASLHMRSFVPVADNIPAPGADGIASDGRSGDDGSSDAPLASAKPPIGVPRSRRAAGAALREALLACEAELLRDQRFDASMSGCTGCVAVICGSDVTVANVGDSRAVLLRHCVGGGGGTSGSFAAAGVTVDHKPTLRAETRRILLKGGRVHATRYNDGGGDGPVRVWLRDEDVPGLAMSRSLGDTVAKMAGVISEPDIYSYTLAPGAPGGGAGDAFLLLASDGLWEFTTPADVARIVTRAAAAAAARKGAGDDAAAARTGLLLELALEELAQVAAERWDEREGCCDDISIVLAEIGWITAS